MPFLPRVGHNKNFPQKMDFVIFMCLLKPDLKQKKSEKSL